MMERYLFEEGRLILKDPALGLDYDAPFAPLRVEETTCKKRLFADGSQEFAVEEGGLWNGEYLLVASDGSVKQRCYYLKGLLHGPATFYCNGQLLVESWFLEGLQEGRCRSYYLSGAPHSLQHYRRGQWHGLQQFWYEDGTLKTVMEYHEGVVKGTVKLYHPHGTLKRELRFD